MIRDIRERLMFMFKNGYRKEGDSDAWFRDGHEDPLYFEEVINDWAYGGGHMTDVCYDYLQYDSDCDSDGVEQAVLTAFFKHHFEVRQIGLTMDQIKEYRPPHNPAKITDPRAKGYVKIYGQRSWEVDALTNLSAEPQNDA